MFNDDNESDMVHVQRIADETVDYLRSLKRDMLISTGKIERGVTEAIRKSELLKRVGELERRQTTTKSAIVRGLSQVLKMINGDD